MSLPAWLLTGYGFVFLVGIRPLAGYIAWDLAKQETETDWSDGFPRKKPKGDPKPNWSDGYFFGILLLGFWPVIAVAAVLLGVGAAVFWLLEAATFLLRFGPEQDAIRAGRTSRVRGLPAKMRGRLGTR